MILAVLPPTAFLLFLLSELHQSEPRVWNYQESENRKPNKHHWLVKICTPFLLKYNSLLFWKQKRKKKLHLFVCVLKILKNWDWRSTSYKRIDKIPWRFIWFNKIAYVCRKETWLSTIQPWWFGELSSLWLSLELQIYQYIMFEFFGPEKVSIWLPKYSLLWTRLLVSQINQYNKSEIEDI